MSFKVDVLKIAERTDMAVFDVEFFKKAEEGEEYTKVGTEFFHKAQVLVVTLKEDSSLHQTEILGPLYKPSVFLDHYSVSFTVVCPKSDKKLLILRIRRRAKNQHFEFKETEILQMPT